MVLPGRIRRVLSTHYRGSSTTGGHRAPAYPGSTLDAAARRGFQPELASCSYDGGKLEQGRGGEASPQNGFYPVFKEHKTIPTLGEGLRRKEFGGSSGTQ